MARGSIRVSKSVTMLGIVWSVACIGCMGRKLNSWTRRAGDLSCLGGNMTLNVPHGTVSRITQLFAMGIQQFQSRLSMPLSNDSGSNACDAVLFRARQAHLKRLQSFEISTRKLISKWPPPQERPSKARRS